MNSVELSNCTFDTRVSVYDRTSAWLLAAIIVFGLLSLGLAATLMRSNLPSPIWPKPIGPPIVVPDGLDKDDLVDPGADLPEVSPEVTDVAQFDQIHDVVSTVMLMIAKESNGEGNRDGDGDGDGRRGPVPVIPSKVNETSRWQISYPMASVDAYSEMLRHFEIELGVVKRHSNEIWKVGEIGESNVIAKTNREREHSSVYFGSIGPRVAAWNRLLLRGVDVSLDDSILVHFYPESAIQQLREAELKALPAGKTVEMIERTRFEAVLTGTDFEFRVEKISFK